MSRPPFIHRLAAALAMLAAIVLTASSAVAQGSPPPIKIEKIEFGYKNVYRPECWTPITIWLSTTKPFFTGTAEISYTQDSSQRAVIVGPVVASSSGVLASHLVWCPTEAMNRVDLVLRDSEGEPVLTRLWSLRPRGNEDLLPSVANRFDHIILAVGPVSVSAFERLGERESQPPSAESNAVSPVEAEVDVSGDAAAPAGQAQVLGSAQTAAVQIGAGGVPNEPQPQLLVRTLAELPIDAAAYDGAAWVVLDSATSGAIDSSAAAALRTYVLRGGRLLLLVDGPGDEWRRWVSHDGTTTPVELAQPARAPLPSEMHSSLPLDAFPLSRAISITPAGRHDGWKVLAPADAKGPGGLGTAASILAVGPVGFGMVAVLGSDPQRWSPTVSTRETAESWKSVLLRLISDGEGNRREIRRTWDGYYQGAGDGDASRNAISVALGFAAPESPASPIVYAVLIAGLVILTIAVGPGDWLVLRYKNLRHRAWATGLGWIALGSLVAYALPVIIRSDRWMARRINVVDVLCDHTGRGSLSWSSGITALSSAGGTRFELEQPVGAWVRGIATSFDWQEPQPRLPALETVLASDPKAGPLGPSRTCDPLPFFMPQWAFRAVAHEAPSDPVNIVISGLGGREEVAIDGLPPEFELESVAVRRHQKWELWEVTQRTPSPRARRLPAQVSYESPSDAMNLSFPIPIEGGGTEKARISHNTLFALPGVRERSLAAERRALAGLDMVHAVFRRVGHFARDIPQSSTPADTSEILLIRAVLQPDPEEP
jgi:hypothetical protein